MSDVIEIQTLLNIYSEAASRGDFASVVETFTEEGSWEVATFGLKFSGHDTIASAQKEFITAMEYLVQMNAPAVIRVDGDKATARSTIRECGKFKDKLEAVEFMGTYVDELERTEKGWKFSKRVFSLIGTHRFQTLGAEAV